MVPCRILPLTAPCVSYRIGNMKPNTRITVKVPLVPYKAGEKTLQVDFNCSSFRDIKKWCTVHVKPAFFSFI